MAFQSRQEFIDAAASQKITLAQVEGRKRLINWSDEGGGVYKKAVDYYVLAVADGQNALNQASTPAVSSGDFYYDAAAGELYIHLVGSVDPATSEVIGTFQFNFSTKSLSLPFDLQETSPDTYYDGRIRRSPGYSHKIGVEQNLTSLVGSGSLSLQNSDGGLDSIYDTYIFENQKIRIYSHNQDLPVSDAKIIFRGRITNKTYSSDAVSFNVKDLLFDLEQQLPQNVFSTSDNVAESVQGDVKRWVYGRVDGLRVQSVDQIAEGYELTGIVSGNTETTTLSGTGTSFLAEVSPEDRITVGTQEFTVESVESDTELTLNDEPDFAFADSTATIVPQIPTRTKNREFFVADHESAQLLKTVTNALQLNRVELSDTVGIRAGDFLRFDDLSEVVEVRNVAPGNIVVLRQNLSARPAVSTAVVREPIQNLFIAGTTVFEEDFTVANSGDTRITIAELTEFNLARTTSLNISFTYTNGTRTISTVEDVDLREIFSPRDWIRPADLTYTTFYEILQVREQEIDIRTSFADPTITDTAEIKQPEYVGDNTIVSVNTLGRTVEGDKNGTWITTVAQANKDIIENVGITDIDAASFTQGESDGAQLISIAFPLDAASSRLTKAKDAIDLLNKSIRSAITLSEALQIKFKVLNVDLPEDARVVLDSDVKSWSIKASSGQNIRNTIIKYRFQDVLRETQESGSRVQTYENEYVRDYIGTNKTGEFSTYLYEDKAAEIMSHRQAYFSELGRADISLVSDLRLEDIEIGDAVKLEFERLYARFGDANSRKKTCVVIGKTVDGEEVKLQLTDLNNTYNTGAVIAPNDAPDYTAADEDQKLLFGYITDGEGIVEDNEDTQNTNLIT